MLLFSDTGDAKLVFWASIHTDGTALKSPLRGLDTKENESKIP
jgi:hypothetical protein